MSREFAFASASSTKDVAASVPHERATQRRSASTIEDTLAADIAEPATGSVRAAPPSAYADDTRPRTILAGVGLLSLITLVALTRRS